MSYQRILVAIDLSDEAEEVMAAAARQAELQQQAEMHLVTVIKPLHSGLGGLDAGGSSVMAKLEADLRAKAEQALQAHAQKLNIPGGSVHLKTGNPAQEIKAVAKDIQADLIVIGTHGRHGLGLLLGSTANGVLHGVECDVLTIRIR
ncbi:MAG: universal stress protein [Pseudomonadales bacterium]